MTQEQDTLQAFARGGAVKSLKDYRQVRVEHIAGAAPKVTAYNFHITDFNLVPDVFQRQIGACQAHAFTEVAMHREYRLTKVMPTLSPRFPYTISKIEDGIVDQGTYTNYPFKVGVKYGVASQAVLPNDTTLSYDAYTFSRSIQNITEAVFTDADKHRIPGYVEVGDDNGVTADQLYQALQREPDGIVIQIAVGSEWWTLPSGQSSWQRSALIPIRKVVSAVDDHDITLIGMETEAGTGRIKCFFRNHWSKNWASTSGIEGGTQPNDLDGDLGWFYFDQHPIVDAYMPSEIPDALLAIIKALPAQKDFSHTWNTDLVVGSSGPEVTALQIALKIVGTFPFNQPVTDYFGGITAGAVVQFQTQYKVASPASIAAAKGNVGPGTRAALNKLFAHN